METLPADAWAILAPGPSASTELASKLPADKLCAVGSAWELASGAKILVATDAAWWRKNPDAHRLPATKFSGTPSPYARHFSSIFGPGVNSGVLALEVVVSLGIRKIALFGFDQHGTHFFGPYTNGLRNTTPAQRAAHLQQFRSWARSNQRVEVFNCTPGSALDAFPFFFPSFIAPKAGRGEVVPRDNCAHG